MHLDCNLELATENLEEQTRFKRRRFWYSYGFVFNFLFVLTMAILFYAIPPVNNSIIKFGYFCLYNFDVFVLVMSIAGILPLVRLGYKGYNISNVKVFYLIISYLLTTFIPIIMLFSYSFHELIVETIKIYDVAFWMYWVGFALALTGPFLMFYAAYKKKNYLFIFLIQALAYIFIWIALIDLSFNYGGMPLLNDSLLLCTIILIVFIILEIILVIRRHKKEGSIEEV